MPVRSEVVQNYHFVLNEIKLVAEANQRDSQAIKLLAVSKKQSVEVIQGLIDACPGVMLGENYVQEFAEKKQFLKGNFQTHLIGPLQSNKVKKAVLLFDVIQSVGSYKLAELISKEAVKINKVQQIYLQVNISQDQLKSGLSPEGLLEEFIKIKALSNIEILGLMTITKYYSNTKDVLPDFEAMVALRKVIELHSKQSLSLSMGMSADYRLAVQVGADLVRVGTDIFGLR